MEKESWILAGVLLFAGYGIAKSINSCNPLIRPGDKLFLFGDSLSVGMDRYFKQFCQGNGVGYGSMTKSGTAAFQWAQPSSGLAARLESDRPTTVLISLGTNDSKGNLTAEKHTEAIRQLVATIRSSGAEPFWILPPKLPWEQHFSDLVRAEGIKVFESSAVQIPMGPDQIHPTGAGYAGWAAMVWQSITCGQPQAMSGPPIRIKKNDSQVSSPGST